MVICSWMTMVILLFLAELLPINDRRAGDVLMEFEHFMTPADITMLIYIIAVIWIGLYAYWQWKKRKTSEGKKSWHVMMERFILLNCLFQCALILLWHFGRIMPCLIAQTVILSLLGFCVEFLNGKRLSAEEYFFIKMPLSFWLGWTFLAVFWTVNACLVKEGLPPGTIADLIWSGAAVLCAGIFSMIAVTRYRDSMFTLAVALGLSGTLWQLEKYSIYNQYSRVFQGLLLSVLVAILLCCLGDLSRCSRFRMKRKSAHCVSKVHQRREI